MNAVAMEAFLARLYTDDALRSAFLAEPGPVMQAAGLDAATQAALQAIDCDGLVLAARSYASKRAAHASRRTAPGLAGRLLTRWPLRRP
jgi:hypothetical protein